MAQPGPRPWSQQEEVHVDWYLLSTARSHYPVVSAGADICCMCPILCPEALSKLGSARPALDTRGLHSWGEDYCTLSSFAECLPSKLTKHSSSSSDPLPWLLHRIFPRGEGSYHTSFSSDHMEGVSPLPYLQWSVISPWGVASVESTKTYVHCLALNLKLWME